MMTRASPHKTTTVERNQSRQVPWEGPPGTTDMVPVCFWDMFFKICGTFAPLPPMLQGFHTLHLLKPPVKNKSNSNRLSLKPTGGNKKYSYKQMEDTKAKLLGEAQPERTPAPRTIAQHSTGGKGDGRLGGWTIISEEKNTKKRYPQQINCPPFEAGFKPTVTVGFVSRRKRQETTDFRCCPILHAGHKHVCHGTLQT